MFAPGIALALLSGLSAPLAQPLIRASGPTMVVGLMYPSAGLGRAELAPVTPRRGAPIGRVELPRLAVVILMGGILGPVLLVSGLERTDAAAATLFLDCKAWQRWPLRGCGSVKLWTAAC